MNTTHPARTGRSARTAFTARSTVALVAVALVASVGCSNDDETADDTTEKTTTTTAAETTTTVAQADALVYPEDQTARITVDPTEVTAGDVVTVSATGFAPEVSLSSSFIGNWPPTEMPDAAHMVTLVPDAAVADADGATTLEVEVPEVCGQGDCYLVVADGLGSEGIYAGMKMTYKG